MRDRGNRVRDGGNRVRDRVIVCEMGISCARWVEVTNRHLPTYQNAFHILRFVIRGRLRRTRRRCVFRLNRIRRLIGVRINLCILCIVSGASAGCQRQYQNHRKQRSQDNIATTITREGDKALADIDKRLEELQTELLKLATSNADYDKVGDEIHRLRDQKQKMQLESANRDELKKRMADMSTFLKKQSTALAEYDEQLIRRLIEKVSIYEDKFIVEFKSGVTVDVDE